MGLVKPILKDVVKVEIELKTGMPEGVIKLYDRLKEIRIPLFECHDYPTPRRYRWEIVYPAGPMRWTCPITGGRMIRTPHRRRVPIDTPLIQEEVQSPRSILEVENKEEDLEEEEEPEEDEEPKKEEEPEEIES
ncbi:hypothetical protein Tco_1102013 [Tanacetum coccineum]